jgi:hypothetical protein
VRWKWADIVDGMPVNGTTGGGGSSSSTSKGGGTGAVAENPFVVQIRCMQVRTWLVQVDG